MIQINEAHGVFNKPPFELLKIFSQMAFYNKHADRLKKILIAPIVLR